MTTTICHVYTCIHEKKHKFAFKFNIAVCMTVYIYSDDGDHDVSEGSVHVAAHQHYN